MERVVLTEQEKKVDLYDFLKKATEIASTCVAENLPYVPMTRGLCRVAIAHKQDAEYWRDRCQDAKNRCDCVADERDEASKLAIDRLHELNALKRQLAHIKDVIRDIAAHRDQLLATVDKLTAERDQLAATVDEWTIGVPTPFQEALTELESWRDEDDDRADAVTVQACIDRGVPAYKHCLIHLDEELHQDELNTFHVAYQAALALAMMRAEDKLRVEADGEDCQTAEAEDNEPEKECAGV